MNGRSGTPVGNGGITNRRHRRRRYPTINAITRVITIREMCSSSVRYDRSTLNMHRTHQVIGMKDRRIRRERDTVKAAIRSKTVDDIARAIRDWTPMTLFIRMGDAP
jgi:hypothetical protein